MIDFDVWFSQIVLCGELVASEDAIERKWVGKETAITSAYNFGEFYEQVFGDLDSEAIFALYKPEMAQDAQAAVATFLSAIEDVDRATTADPDLLDQSTVLLMHPTWNYLRQAATTLIHLPSALPYRSGRIDIKLDGKRGEADMRLWQRTGSYR